MKKNLGCILTAIDEPSEAQTQAVVNWVPAAAMTYVLSKHEIKNKIGLTWQKSYKPKPLLKDSLQNYMGRIRGYETIGLVSPDVTVNPDFTKLHEAVVGQRLQMAWAFRFEIDSLPKMFVVSTPLIAHMLNACPERLVFDGPEWPRWVHEWITKSTLPHRYVDGTSFGNVSTVPPEAPQDTLEPVLRPFEPLVATPDTLEAEKPVKAKETPLPAVPAKKVFLW